MDTAKIFIREWMVDRQLDQRQLAVKMGRSEGAISKKFAAPERIDVGWLTEFADALHVTVAELFYPPGAARLHPLSPKMAEFFEVAGPLSDDQVDGLLALLHRKPSVEPQQEHSLASVAAPPPKAPSAQ